MIDSLIRLPQTIKDILEKRKKNEITLRESQARLQMAVKAANVGLWDWDLQSNTIYFSPEWKSQIGYEEYEITNDFSEWQSRVHPDDLERATRTVQAYLAKPWPNYENEFRFRHKDGSYRWILARASLLLDNDGQPYRMLGSHIDITERKRMEEALSLSEARYADLYEHAPDMYASVEAATGKIIQCNQTLAQVTGYSKEEIIGRPVFELYHPDCLEEAKRAFQSFVTTGQVRDAELQLRCKDGRRLDVSLNVSAVRDEAGQIRYSRSIWRDITARKQAEEAVRRERDFSEAILDSLPGVFYLYDQEHRFLRWNKNFTQVTGYTDREMAERSPLDFFSGPDKELLAERIQEVFSKGASAVEANFVAKDGVRTPYYFTGLRVLLDNKVCLLGMGIDITERKRAEKALKRSEQVLQLFVENAPAAIAMLDREMRYISASRRYLSDYDLGDQDLTGRSHYDVFPEMPDRWKEIHRRCLAGAIAKADEDPFLRANGKLDWVRWEIHPWYESTGEIGGIMLFSEVITQRKQAEAESYRYTQRLETLHQIDRAILVADSMKDIAAAALQRLIQLIPCQHAAIGIFDLDRQEVEVLAGHAQSQTDFGPGFRLPLGEVLLDVDLLQQGQVYQVEDYEALAEVPLLVARIRQEGLRSSLAVPLLAGDTLIGLLGLGRSEPGKFDSDHIEIAGEVADQLAVALTNARLLADIRQRLQELMALQRASLAFGQLLDPVTLGRRVIEVIEQQLGYQRGAIFTLSPEGGVSLLAHSSVGLDPAAYQAEQDRVRRLVQTDRGISAWVARHGRGVRLGDVRQDPRYVEADPHIKSELCVPLQVSGKTIGSLNVESDRPYAFTEHDERLLTILAGQAAVALENAHLFEQIQRHAEELEQRVAERTAELREQYRQQAAYEERQRLARDLHDAVSQTLFSASLLAEAIPHLWQRNPEQARQGLAELHRLNRGALAEMRNLLLELRPAALAEISLRDLLEQLANALMGRTRLTVSVEVKGDYNPAPDVRVAFYRVAQEAFNNIAKHARASQVSITLLCRPKQLALTIIDDGRGFDPQQLKAGHFGLEIMRERAKAIGASLKITSEPGRGTEIVVTWSDQ